MKDLWIKWNVSLDNKQIVKKLNAIHNIDWWEKNSAKEK